MFRLTIVLVLFLNVFGKTINVPSNHLLQDERIVGGEETTIEKYPYQIALEANGLIGCGGSLIAPNVVLTAAHCLVGGWYFQVRAGSSIKETGGQFAEVIEFCDHPKYVYTSYDYDVVVLQLNQSFTLGESVQTIELQSSGVEVPTGTLGTVTGWGRTASGAPISDILKVTEVPKVDDGVCKTRYPKRNITERMTCYGYDKGGKDTCKGDSGGPLVVNGKQVGITSWGTGCAVPFVPGIYTRIENEEIISHIKYCLTKFQTLPVLKEKEN